MPIKYLVNYIFNPVSSFLLKAYLFALNPSFNDFQYLSVESSSDTLFLKVATSSIDNESKNPFRPA